MLDMHQPSEQYSGYEAQGIVSVVAVLVIALKAWVSSTWIRGILCPESCRKADLTRI